MFRTILISVVTLMHLYVFFRAASVPYVRRHVTAGMIIGIGIVLWIIFFFTRFFRHGGPGDLAAILELTGMAWMGVLFLCTVVLLPVDLITGFGVLFPRMAPTLRGWALVAGAILSAIALFQGFRPPVVKPYEIRLSGLSKNLDGTVIVALSDLHLGRLLDENWMAARAEQILAQKPDIVVMLGDLFEGRGLDRDKLLGVMRRISAPLGVYAVYGNHEFHGDRNADLQVIEMAGFQVLRNRWVEVTPGLVLAGVDDLTTARRAGRNGEEILIALADRPPGATVLMSHTPLHADLAADAGAGLMLCGHTHGGQLWPFGYLVRLRYPMLAGRYQVEDMPVIVCRGTGTWGPRMRLWRPGEILRITLRTR